MKITQFRDGKLKYAFFCPGCQMGHWFETNRWIWNGDHERPTIRPSILAWADDFRCHSFVTDGKIRFLPDCTHALANQTVDLPDFPGTAGMDSTAIVSKEGEEK